MSDRRELWLPACPEIRRWVKGYGCVRSMEPEVREALYPPRAEASLLIRWNGDDVSVNAIGPLTRARRKVHAAPSMYVRIVFCPGRSRELLGVPIRELADRVVPIDELWPANRLRDSLVGAKRSDSMALIEAALVERSRGCKATPKHDALMSHAIRSLDTSKGRVAIVARDLGLSERHLRRLFLDEVGMTPKHYARIARLQRVMSQPSSPWIIAAADAGFHDQAHLIREFRDLLDVTPAAFRKRRE